MGRWAPLAVVLSALALAACSQHTPAGGSSGADGGELDEGGSSGSSSGGSAACAGGCRADQACIEGKCQAISCAETGTCPNGLLCSDGVCVSAGGSGGSGSSSGATSSRSGSSSGTGSSSGSSSTSGASSGSSSGSASSSGSSSSTRSSSAPSSSSATSTTTSSSSSTTSGSSSSGGSSSGPPVCASPCQAQATCQNGACVCPGSYQYVNDLCAYCDGFACDDASQNQILVDTNVFYGALLGGGCLDELQADAGTYATVGGILDTDTDDDGSASPIEAIFPGGCDDMGLGPYTGVGDGGMNYTAPAAPAVTVAQAVASQGSGMTVYGVVTAVYGWTVSPAKSGLFYLQDPASGAPPAGSGVAVYAQDKFVASLGSTVPARGAVVEVTGLDYKPFQGQTELAITSGSTLTVLGNAPLPAPVALPASALGPAGGAASNAYKGMRVVSQSSSCQVVNACPTDLQYIDP